MASWLFGPSTINYPQQLSTLKVSTCMGHVTPRNQ